MASISEYKTRIKSTSSLQQIFKAQELIATSRIKKARDNALATLPYANKIESALKCVAQKNKDISHPFLKLPKSKQKNIALVVISSDRGMAGAYNSSIIRLTESLIQEKENDGSNVSLYPIGKRAAQYFSNHYDKQCASTFIESSENPTFEFCEKIVDKLVEDYLNPDIDYDEIIILYTKFKNMVTQIPSNNQLLPLDIEKVDDKDELGILKNMPEEIKTVGKKHLDSLYEFEPSAESLLDVLIPKYLTTAIFHFLLESAASETASRQSAMHTANDNANDLLENLVRKSNQARQANITNELNEMASAAESLKG